MDNILKLSSTCLSSLIFILKGILIHPEWIITENSHVFVKKSHEGSNFFNVAIGTYLGKGPIFATINLWHAASLISPSNSKPNARVTAVEQWIESAVVSFTTVTVLGDLSNAASKWFQMWMGKKWISACTPFYISRKEVN